MTRPPRIDLNQASEAQLVRALRITPRLAQRIIRMRPYHSTADLRRIWGLDDDLRVRLAALFPAESPAGEPAAAPSPAPSRVQIVEPAPPPLKREPFRLSWGTLLALLAILLVGAWLRLSNLNWDANTHQNPDERFMTIVAERIQPVDPGSYFDTANSTLNPFQGGAGYTYGMLPLFVTRMVGGWLNMTRYDQVVLVGRALSALFDLAGLLLLYLLGRMLFGRRVGLLAAGLYAVAVLPIQMSHYFTVDSFATVFILAGFLFAYQAVPLLDERTPSARPNLLYFGLFGLVTGLAMACKINAIAFFGVIGLAAAAHLVVQWPHQPSRKRTLLDLLKGLAIAAAVGFAAFRIANPYTFMGPGFFNLQINPRWLQIMKEVTGQVAGLSEWPPNHHWTSRGTAYAWLNIVQWGLGWPLGLAAWASWAYALWRSLKGEWRRLLLPVAWAGGYFLWQNFQFWRYMRYFLPVYAVLVLLAAWGLLRLWDWARASRGQLAMLFRRGERPAPGIKGTLPGLAALLALTAVIGYTVLYAFGFADIYRQPITRVAASRWMLRNIRGPLNLVVDSADGSQTYPIAAPSAFTFASGESYHSSFIPLESGTAGRIETYRVRLALADLRVKFYTGDDKKTFLGEGFAVLPPGDPRTSIVLTLPSLKLEAGKPYRAVYTFKTNGPGALGDAVLGTDKDTDPTLAQDWSLTASQARVQTGSWDFTPAEDLRINRLTFGSFSAAIDPADVRIKAQLTADDAGKQVLAESQAEVSFPDGSASAAPLFTFDPVPLAADTTYFVRYTVARGGALIFEAEPYALETRWDDSLPLSSPPYNIGGIYAPIDLKLYEPDTEVKRQAMIDALDRVQYLVLPSNRAYDSMPRLTLRYPLTTAYYQALFDCGCSGDAMEARAAALETGFHSPLGFDLVAVFTHYPSVGPFTLNDQLADESFTVYDHPKVMIFRKSADYSPDKVRARLEAVDLTQVVFQKPIDVSKNPTGYQMPADRLAAQQAGGTWASLFNLRSLLNTSQPAGVIAWYLLIWALGVLFLPVTFAVFRGLPDRGYPLARILALLTAAWLSWLLASVRLVPFARWTAAGVVLLLAALNVLLALRRREELRTFIQARWRHLLGVEVLFLVLFGLALLLRLGDPDLWQPWTGGEKPMNLAIFSSLLKSTWFPPLHPWLSGYYLNYYYFGYVLAAVPTLLLGIEPAFAYNLILPTWFAMTGVGIFCAASALALRLTGHHNGEDVPAGSRDASRIAWTAGLAAVILMLVLGNLFQVSRLWQGLPEAASVESPETLTGVSRLMAAVNGAARVIRGEAELPGSKSSWYFDPSRPILNGVNGGKETPIAEFPLFTYLYGDMHPHLLVMPLLFLALAWLLAFFFEPERPGFKLRTVLFWAAGGLILGSFRAANTWDYYTLLGLGVVAAAWTSWQAQGRVNKAALVDFGVKAGLLLVLSYGLYYPFGKWFVTGYNSVALWTGSRTPLGDYLTVHGVFLFVLVSYLILESGLAVSAWIARWKAKNGGWLMPPVKVWLRWAVILGTAGVAAFVMGQLVPILPLVLVLLVWIGLLVFQRGQDAAKQFILALFAAGLLLTLLVEVVTLKGDIGRMNVVFKLYMQVWAIFSLAGGAALALLLRNWRRWIPEWRWPWAVMLALLVLGGLTYPITAIPMRLSDRWPGISQPPVTLNGMDYMLGEAANVRADYDPAQGAVYDDNGAKLQLGYDFAGIRFMQENVTGTPTIVEGIRGEYRWTGRYSVYTGLPAVASWSWHVRQHLSLMDPAVVDNRIEDVKAFYDTPDPQAALAFLRRYRVSYVIVGDMERAFYAAEGLQKYPLLVQQGQLKEVFKLQGSDGGVQIYQVENTQ